MALQYMFCLIKHHRAINSNCLRWVWSHQHQEEEGQYLQGCANTSIHCLRGGGRDWIHLRLNMGERERERARGGWLVHCVIA